MGCSRRVKASEIRADQRWDFISLGDFKSTNYFGGFAYVYLLGSLLVSIAVYGVDTFTAVNLLVFDKWSGKIEPKIELKYSKWIFSACIIASWVNLAYEYFRALRVIKRGAVAESYLDSLAVRLQCVRWTKSGRGWRRFLVFAELTKSKKGAEYVALFTYFSFQSWIRIIFCQGPRQVVNAFTLYAVLESQLFPTKGGDVGSVLSQFFQKIGTLAEEDNQQALILSGMLFTLVIWVFGALSLILAVLFYIFFLWHYIPNGDGGLSGYCEIKINKRLAAIVSVKVNKAIAEEERKRVRADANALKKGDKPQFGRQATLPTLFDPKDPPGSDQLPPMPMMDRKDTMNTLPAYTSRPGTPSGQPTVAIFELDQLDNKRPAVGRSITGTSFGSNAPLMSNASDMGYGRSASPAPSLPNSRNGYPAPIRTMTSSSQNSQWNKPRMPGDGGYESSPVSYDNRGPPPNHMSNFSQSSVENYGRPINPQIDRSFTPAGPAPSMGRRTPFEENSSIGWNSPATFTEDYGAPIVQPMPQRGPTSDYGRNSPAPTVNGRFPVVPNNEYQAFDPTIRSASAAPTPYPTSSAPYQTSSTPGPLFQQERNNTPGPIRDFSRPGTAQSNRPPQNQGFQQGRNITEPVRGTQRDYFGGDGGLGTRQQTPAPGLQIQNRNVTEPVRQQDYYRNSMERPGTAQSGRPPYNGGGGNPPGAGGFSQGYRQ